MCEVMVDQSWWGHHLCGYELPEKLSVTQGGAVGAVSLYQVLVKLPDLNNYSCLVPFERVRAGLVLDAYMVTNLERGEALCMLR